MAKPKAQVGSWVRLTWHDAADESQTWMREQEIDEEVVEVYSVGYLIRLTNKYYTIAGDYHRGKAPSGDPHPDIVFGRVTRVPFGMVQKIEVLD